MFSGTEDGVSPEGGAADVHPPMSASQSSGSVACLELPFRKPLEEDSVTPLVKWSTSMSMSVLRRTETEGLACLSDTSDGTDVSTEAGAVCSQYLLMGCWLRLPLRLMSDTEGLDPEPAGQDL